MLKRRRDKAPSVEYRTSMRRAPKTSPRPPLINFPNEVPNTALDVILEANDASDSSDFDDDAVTTSVAMTDASVMGTATEATDNEYATKMATLS